MQMESWFISALFTMIAVFGLVAFVWALYRSLIQVFHNRFDNIAQAAGLEPVQPSKLREIWILQGTREGASFVVCNEMQSRQLIANDKAAQLGINGGEAVFNTVHMTMPHTLPTALSIEPSGFLTRVGLMSDLATGDEHFDAHFRVQAAEPEVALRFLTSEVREALMDLSSLGTVSLKAQKCTYTQTMPFQSKQALRDVVEDLLRVMHALHVPLQDHHVSEHTHDGEGTHDAKEHAPAESVAHADQRVF